MKLRKLLLTVALGATIALPASAVTAKSTTAVPASTVAFDGGNCSATFVRSASGLIIETERTCDFFGFDGEDIYIEFRPTTGTKIPNPRCGENTIVEPFSFSNVEPSLAGYFIGTNPYNVCAYLVDDTVDGTVDSADADGVTVELPVAGGNYRIDVTGTWANGTNNVADAEYTSRDGWVTPEQGYNVDPYFLGEDFGDLMVNGGFVDWGTYNASHAYSTTVTNVSSVELLVFDGQSGSPEPSWYGDNVGSLTYTITFLGLAS